MQEVYTEEIDGKTYGIVRASLPSVDPFKMTEEDIEGTLKSPPTEETDLLKELVYRRKILLDGVAWELEKEPIVDSLSNDPLSQEPAFERLARSANDAFRFIRTEISEQSTESEDDHDLDKSIEEEYGTDRVKKIRGMVSDAIEEDKKAKQEAADAKENERRASKQRGQNINRKKMRRIRK